MSAPTDVAAIAEADAFEQAKADAQATAKPAKHDSGMPVAIPDIPAVDSGDDEPPSIPSVEERSMWSPGQVEESPKLAEARAAMMQTLMSSGQATRSEARAVGRVGDPGEAVVTRVARAASGRRCQRSIGESGRPHER